MKTHNYTRPSVALLCTIFVLFMAGCGADTDNTLNQDANSERNNHFANNATENNSTENNSTENNSSENNSSENNSNENNGVDNNASQNNSSDNNDANNNHEEDLLEIPDGPYDIMERGPYNVGFRSIYMTYNSRKTGEERRIRLAVWYPTRQKDGESGKYFTVINRPEVIANAKPAHGEGELPVLVFSHGNASIAEQSYFMTEYYASHGWLVASPDHTDNTAIDTEGSINFSSAVDRPQDISAVIDKLYDLPENHPARGLASQDIIMSGHSFGGLTALLNGGANADVDHVLDLCEQGAIGDRYCEMFTPQNEEIFREGFFDNRIKAIIPQTPGGAKVFHERINDVQVPVLMFTGEEDDQLRNENEGDPMWERLQGEDHRRINVLGAGHFAFSNMCAIFDGLPVDGLLETCGEGFIDPDEAFEIINVYSMAFSHYHLFGDTSYMDILSGETIISDKAIFYTKAE